MLIIFGLAVSFTLAGEPSGQEQAALFLSCQAPNPYTSWKITGNGFRIRDKIEPNKALDEQLTGDRPVQLMPAINKNRALFPKKILSGKGWQEVEEIDGAKFDFDAIQFTEVSKTLVIWMVDDDLGFLAKLDDRVPERSRIRFPYTAECSRSGYVLEVTSLDEPTGKESVVRKPSSTR
jgi:hypothetical protein